MAGTAPAMAARTGRQAPAVAVGEPIDTLAKEYGAQPHDCALGGSRQPAR